MLGSSHRWDRASRHRRVPCLLPLAVLAIQLCECSHVSSRRADCAASRLRCGLRLAAGSASACRVCVCVHIARARGCPARSTHAVASSTLDHVPALTSIRSRRRCGRLCGGMCGRFGGGAYDQWRRGCGRCGLRSGIGAHAPCRACLRNRQQACLHCGVLRWMHRGCGGRIPAGAQKRRSRVARRCRHAADAIN